MTEYRDEDGNRFTGAEVFGYLKSGTWTLRSSDVDRRIIENADGDTLVLRKIPGTERSTTGPHCFTPD